MKRGITHAGMVSMTCTAVHHRLFALVSNYLANELKKNATSALLTPVLESKLASISPNEDLSLASLSHHDLVTGMATLCFPQSKTPNVPDTVTLSLIP
jgi:hypothetical protein